MEPFLEILSITRDAAIVFLVVQFLLLGAVPVFLLLKTTQGLRWVLRRLVPSMRQAQDKVGSVSVGIDRGLAAVRRPFVWGNRLASRVGSRAVTEYEPFDRGRST